jgi:collagenase-like PrtC family protease
LIHINNPGCGLSLAQVKQVAASSPAKIEVFGFGSPCVMIEGRYRREGAAATT